MLRLGTGDAVRIFDGTGREWTAHIGVVSSGNVEVTLDREVETVREPSVNVTLAIGLLKGDQMDAVVRESTALGVAAIVPLVSMRVVAPARARVEAAQARWRRVAVQSAKQCGRAVVPTIDAPVPFADLLLNSGFDVRVMLAEPVSGGRISEQPPPGPAVAARAGEPRGARALVIVGPEGGWTVDEIRQAVTAGIPLWRLGPRTLRAELAPTVALAALWTHWGW